MIFNTEFYLQKLKTEFETGAIDDILQVAAEAAAAGYWNEQQLLYFMKWFYLLTTDSQQPEIAAKQNRGCPFCIQKTKIFINELIKALKDEAGAAAK